MRSLSTLVIALALGWDAPAAADVKAPATNEQITRESAAEALAEAARRARNRDSQGIVAVLRPVVRSPVFAALSEEQRYWICVLLGTALYQTEAYAEAVPILRQASEFREADDDDWSMRFWGALAVEDHADAATSLATLARRWPAAVNMIPSRAVWAVQYDVRSREDGEALQLSLLQALHQAPWLPANEPFNDNSYLWASLTRLHIDRGETAHARRVAQDVQNAGAIARMMIDRRFDGVIERAPAELVSLYEADLGRIRALTAAHPNRLEGVNRLAEALMELDRGEEAVALVDAALARADSRRGFEDQDEHLNWTRNHRAWALLSVGRGREAAEEMARGARLPERGGVNVSQLINLAELYLRLGRNEEAAATLNDLDLAQVSGYGWMNAHYVLACAKQELGAHAEAEAVLAQMRARRGDSKMILRGTELCFDHFDEAARLYIEDLDDAEERERTLLDAQTYIEPRHQTDFQRRMAARWKTLLARADVRAAVERHGRIIAFPVRPQNY